MIKKESAEFVQAVATPSTQRGKSCNGWQPVRFPLLDRMSCSRDQSSSAPAGQERLSAYEIEEQRQRSKRQQCQPVGISSEEEWVAGLGPPRDRSIGAFECA